MIPLSQIRTDEICNRLADLKKQYDLHLRILCQFEDELESSANAKKNYLRFKIRKQKKILRHLDARREINLDK